MTVASSIIESNYVGAGTTGPFPTGFYFILPEDVIVSVNGVVKTYNVDYTMTGIADSAGGTVTFTAAVGVGALVKIRLSPPMTQRTQYIENSAFPAKPNERALDKLTQIILALSNRVDSALSGLGGEVPITAFGPTGTGDDTATFITAFANATALFLPAGDYYIRMNSVFAGVGLKSVRGAGIGLTRIHAIGAAVGQLIFFNATSLFRIQDFSVIMDVVTYAANICLYFSGVSKGHIRDVYFQSAGACAIRGDNCTDVLVERVRAENWAIIGIDFHTGSNRVVLDHCNVPGTGTQTGHCMQIAGPGVDCAIFNSYGTKNQAGSFVGVLYNITRGFIMHSTALGGIAEGFNFQNTTDGIIGSNIVYGDPAAADFGISVFGDGVAGGVVTNVDIIGNTIYRCGKAGIALANFVSGVNVTGNKIRDPNQLNQAQWGGITVYGVGCQFNTVQNNLVTDSTGKCKYAANEWNDGTGNPDHNTLKDNMVVAGGLTAETAILGPNSQEWQMNFSAWLTPNGTGANGVALGAPMTNNSYLYRVRGKECTVQFDFAIPNQGGADSGLQVDLPRPSIANGGTLCGRVSLPTGKGATAVCYGSFMIIRTADTNAFPGGSGGAVNGGGVYIIA